MSGKANPSGWRIVGRTACEVACCCAVCLAFLSFVFGHTVSGVSATDALACATLAVSALAFSAGCLLAFAAVRAYRHADRLEQQVMQAEKSLLGLKESRSQLMRSVRELAVQAKHYKNGLRDMAIAVRRLEAKGGNDKVIGRAVERHAKGPSEEDLRAFARMMLPICDAVEAGVHLRHLFVCGKREDIPLLDIVRQRFPKNKELMALCNRVEEVLEGRE